MKKIILTFKNLSTAKKILLIVVFIFGLFSIFWWILSNYIFYYLSVTYGIPVISEFTGISAQTVEWLIFSLPLYFNIFIATIIITIAGLFYIKKLTSKEL